MVGCGYAPGHNLIYLIKTLTSRVYLDIFLLYCWRCSYISFVLFEIESNVLVFGNEFAVESLFRDTKRAA